MAYRLLLDENLEHEVLGRLEDRHDVQHVDFVTELGKGTDDESLARYSIETDRTIVTYDDDFVDEVSPEQYRAVLFFEDDTLPARDIAAVVDAMSAVYPHEQVVGLQKVGREWL
jgi:predicted nuclease of predicted toxin-antitoxin system